MTTLTPQIVGEPTSLAPAVDVNQDQSGEINPLQRAAAAPRIKTNLVLTPSQLDAITTRALDRIDELSGEMGLQGNGQVDAESWMGQREKNQAQYDNDWGWRAALGGIFAFSNFSINIAKRYVRLIAAKTRDDLVGTDPFFSVMPEHAGDPDVAKNSEWYVQEKVRQSNAKKAIGIGLKTAAIRNECVMKPTYVSQTTKFRGPGRVAVGPNVYEGAQGPVYAAQGEPIMTPRGNYIYERDDFIPDPNVEGIVRLRKEPMVQFRNQLEFAYFDDLDQTMVHQEGLDIRSLDYRDFLCPLNAHSIHEADICVHLFDEQHERLVFTYGIFEVSEAYCNQPYMSGEKSPKEKQGEQEAGSKILRIVNCADVYMRCDADDDGVEEEIWMILDRKARKAIWYDYLGAHLKKRPFEVLVGLEQVPNRWYGVGVFEMLAHKQLYIDTQFNRVNFKSSKSSSVRFRNKNAVAQWKAGQELIFGDDQIYDIEDPRYDARNPPLFQVQLTEVDEHAMSLLQVMLQASSSEIGIAGPNDAAMAGLDTTKLAEGIKAMERTGNVLMKDTESSHNESIVALLEQAMNIILEHMNEDELLYREDTGSLIQLNREEIRTITKEVRLLLTRSRSTETIETARMVVQLCREYYEALTPLEQHKLRDEYLRQLRALEVQDANELLTEVTEEDVAAWQEAQKQAPTLEPKTSIATKYTDLERQEQIQILQREGIQPAPVGPMTTNQEQEVNQTAAEADAKAKAAARYVKPTPTGNTKTRPAARAA